ncbi:MAG TPA: winged helix-turn-helix domain-containing protein [Elusimicrobiales bacterium]|nr:winged helix-turn-helix domain-containing protein [Elusimicrobiales bacterium]
MSENVKFTDSIPQTAEKIADMLKGGAEATSWDIKLKLRLSSSSLYLALGWLAAQGRINMYPQDLNFRVKLIQGQ